MTRNVSTVLLLTLLVATSFQQLFADVSCVLQSDRPSRCPELHSGKSQEEACSRYLGCNMSPTSTSPTTTVTYSCSGHLTPCENATYAAFCEQLGGCTICQDPGPKCPIGSICTNGHCGIPEGVFRDPVTPAIYSSKGTGSYCTYSNMEQFWCINGRSGHHAQDWDWLHGRAQFSPRDFPYASNDGACRDPKCTSVIPEGVFRDQHSAAIYYSNGSGQYCSYKNMKQLWCMTGHTGSGKWKWLHSTPQYSPTDYTD